MTENTQQPQNQSGQTIIVNQSQQQSNGIGTAGFVLALIGLFLGWIPVLGWIIWLLGLIFSFIGLFKTPKGLSITGLIISLLGIIVILIVAFGTAVGVASFR